MKYCILIATDTVAGRQAEFFTLRETGGAICASNVRSAPKWRDKGDTVLRKVARVCLEPRREEIMAAHWRFHQMPVDAADVPRVSHVTALTGKHRKDNYRYPIVEVTVYAYNEAL